jgi:hypothetical protein
MQIALPYSILVLVMRVLLFRQCIRHFDSSQITMSILKWFGVLLFPAPAVLLIVWVVFFTFPVNWLSGPNHPTSEGGYVLSLLELLLLLGLPYAILSLLVHYFLLVRQR